jgi:hypothetical protein
VWPRATAAATQRFVQLCDGVICNDVFVPLGNEEFHAVISRVERCRPDAVIMLLVGKMPSSSTERSAQPAWIAAADA